MEDSCLVWDRVLGLRSDWRMLCWVLKYCTRLPCISPGLGPGEPCKHKSTFCSGLLPEKDFPSVFLALNLVLAVFSDLTVDIKCP